VGGCTLLEQNRRVLPMTDEAKKYLDEYSSAVERALLSLANFHRVITGNKDMISDANLDWAIIEFDALMRRRGDVVGKGKES
jgi:hypothetical protein